MPSPTDIQKALGGVDYPATKAQLIDHARSHGASDDVLSALGAIDDREYEGPSGVSKAVFSGS
jgi:hypothetical protein